ncbi:MAG: hypothetical protein SP1CHLAM54_17200 [Chlamydiia bacterium]|nr:hypothetical protein [Chlamydiia bacterium]MCH9616608.1 hypothetical protein [Chlamydiia bacterium]
MIALPGPSSAAINSFCKMHQARIGLDTLHYLALVGNVSGLRKALKEGRDVNVLDRGGRTPMHYAALAGHNHVMLLLMIHGGNTRATDMWGGYPRDIRQYTAAKTGELIPCAHITAIQMLKLWHFVIPKQTIKPFPRDKSVCIVDVSRLEVRMVASVGKALFTKDPLPAGTFVGPYYGIQDEGSMASELQEQYNLSPDNFRQPSTKDRQYILAGQNALGPGSITKYATDGAGGQFRALIAYRGLPHGIYLQLTRPLDAGDAVTVFYRDGHLVRTMANYQDLEPVRNQETIRGILAKTCEDTICLEWFVTTPAVMYAWLMNKTITPLEAALLFEMRKDIMPTTEVTYLRLANERPEILSDMDRWMTIALNYAERNGVLLERFRLLTESMFLAVHKKAQANTIGVPYEAHVAYLLRNRDPQFTRIGGLDRFELVPCATT